MATKKRTVITVETHEVWIIRQGLGEVYEAEPFVADEPESALALEPGDEEEG